MITLLVGLALILLGLVLILLKKKGKPQTSDAASSQSKGPSDASSEAKKEFVPGYNLEDLMAPSNFPAEIVFYFGS